MVCCLPKGQACLNGIVSQSGKPSERSKVPESILLNQSAPRFTGERDNSKRNRNACTSSVFLLGFSNYRSQPADEKREQRGRGGVKGVCHLTPEPEHTIQWLLPLLLPLFWQTALSISQVFGSFFPLWQRRASFMYFVCRRFTHIWAKTRNTDVYWRPLITHCSTTTALKKKPFQLTTPRKVFSVWFVDF